MHGYATAPGIAPLAASVQGQQDATVNSVQQAGQLSDAQQQQPEVLQQKPLRDTSWPQDEQKAQQQQQHEQEQQQQHRADVAASITEQTPKVEPAYL